MTPKEKVLLPTRAKSYGVGKAIGGSVYLHRQYEISFGPALLWSKQHLPEAFDYTIVKYNTKRESFSFIHSPDFDEAPEPMVGLCWIVYADGRTQCREPLADPEIYHHKWLFVADDYKGFSVEDSKERSLQWVSLKPPVDRSRIGRRSYWAQSVLPRLSG